MTYARALLALLIIGMGGSLWWVIDSNAETKAKLAQSEAAVKRLAQSYTELMERNDATDKQLAATARNRQRLEREADSLARQLESVQTDRDCLNTRLPGAALIWLREYRGNARGRQGASAEDLDGSAASAGDR